MTKKIGLLLSLLLVVSLALSSASITRAQQPVTFIFGRGTDGVGLDSAIVTDGDSFRVTNQGCEGLMAYEKNTTNTIPSLAESYEASADGKTWTFKLRKGVKFHDGTPFNAEAVKWNFDRWRLTTHPAHLKEQVFEYWEAMFNGFDDKSLVTDVKVVDENTVQFVLAEPLAPLLANLAMSMFAIHSPTAIKEYGPDYGTPKVGYVCTGPYKFVEWKTGDTITLERFKDYWGKVEGNVERIIVRTIKDNAARYAALQKGEIHAMEQANKEDLTNAAKSKDLVILTRPALNTFYLAFNFKIKELQDVRVRRAISMALNREEIVKAFFGEYGQVADNFLPPLVWGHNKEVKAPKFDPAAAKKLLADAGFPNGIKEVTMEDGKKGPLVLYYMPVVRFYNPDGKGIAAAQAKYLADIGIQVEIKTEGDWAGYLAARQEGKLMGLYQLGWGGDNGDPDNFLCYFFCDPNLPREGFYTNAKLHEMLKQARSTVKQEDRQKLYEDAEKLLAEDVGRIFIAHNQTPLLFRAQVKGYVPNPVQAELYRFVTIEAK